MASPQHRARKRFGQNFLHDPRVIARIVDAIDPRPGDSIVEIGPGRAALTRRLIERTGHISALEIDRDLAAWLRSEFPPDQLSLIVGDALDFDWSTISGPLRIVGNLPYNISSPLLFALVPIAERVTDQHFMLQKEVVDRMVASPGSRTYRSAVSDAAITLSADQTLRRRTRRVPAGAGSDLEHRTHAAAAGCATTDRRRATVRSSRVGGVWPATQDITQCAVRAGVGRSDPRGRGRSPGPRRNAFGGRLRAPGRGGRSRQRTRACSR